MTTDERSPQRAWSPEYLRRLLGAAKGMKGSFHGFRRADFWTAWILLASETSSRASEMFDFEIEQIEGDGGLKGKSLTDDAKTAALKLLGPRKYLFAGLAPKRELLREFSVMQKKANRR